MRRLAWVMLFLVFAARAAADGGKVRLKEDVGPFSVTVFTAPDPLRVGRAEVSVLVQDRVSQEVLLDPPVELALRGPGESAPQTLGTSRGSNRLLQVAPVALTSPGDWDLEVTIRRGGARESISCRLPVGPAPPVLAAIWPFLTAPPVSVALFVLHRALRRRRPDAVM